MVKLEPFNCSNCFFLNSENRRLTVSRVVPIICANSSGVYGQNLRAVATILRIKRPGKQQLRKPLRQRVRESEDSNLLNTPCNSFG
jgi:hypothetical protein